MYTNLYKMMIDYKNRLFIQPGWKEKCGEESWVLLGDG